MPPDRVPGLAFAALADDPRWSRHSPPFDSPIRLGLGRRRGLTQLWVGVLTGSGGHRGEEQSGRLELSGP